MRILITGGKSALAFKLLKNFKQQEVILADYGEMPQFPSTSCEFISLGALNTDTVAHSLLTFCLDHMVDALLPVYDFEMEAVGKSRILFEEFDIQVLKAVDLAEQNRDYGI
jgi:hypothetical protein